MIYPFIVIRSERMKSSSNVSGSIVSNNSRRTANSSPAAPHRRIQPCIKAPSTLIHISSKYLLRLYGYTFFSCHAAHFRIPESKHNFPDCLAVDHRVGVRKETTSGVRTSVIPVSLAAVFPCRFDLKCTVAFPVPTRLQSFVCAVIASVRHPYG